jgi:hypothetical protein
MNSRHLWTWGRLPAATGCAAVLACLAVAILAATGLIQHAETKPVATALSLIGASRALGVDATPLWVVPIGRVVKAIVTRNGNTGYNLTKEMIRGALFRQASPVLACALTFVDVAAFLAMLICAVAVQLRPTRTGGNEDE